ncbi:MAG: hypothetical protein IKI49_04825 [Oscillospiraceae bacterium]|nr:hypothetical protein [Oscillospiraceae bacterium]
MKRNISVYRMVIAALLVAVGILIPMTFPKITIPPMSFTLASHVAIFLACFISPITAAAVAVGTTIGFALTLPLPVVLRAASHIVWALVGALWLRKKHSLLTDTPGCVLFCVVIGLIHAAGEVLVLMPLYFGNMLTSAVYESGFFTYIILLVGLGTFLHSSVDFIISLAVWKALRRLPIIRDITPVR